jgi:SAM-dependent methyltransferase
MIVLLAYALSLVLLWVLIPAFYGLPLVPTRLERIRKALKLANLQPNEILYDLGAGDGRVLFLAAREFGAKAVGIEIGPVQCLLIWLRTLIGGARDQVQIRWANFYKADLHEADVIFVYATSTEVEKLASHLKAQMKRGSRLISISADFPGWEPSVLDQNELIFVYEMPPQEGSITSYLLKVDAG